MHIALAQLNYHVGNFELNTNKIIETIKKAEKQHVDLIIFSELSVCGYTPHDLLEQHDFIVKSQEALHKIAANCTGETAAIVGVPLINTNPKGKNLYNAACLVGNGKVITSRFKTLLPTYDIFDEYRYFEPNDQFELVEWKGKRFALTICEDLWDKQPSAYFNAKGELYKQAPMKELIKQNPDFIINIAASPYSHNQGKVRGQVMIDNALRYKLPVFYVNQMGGNTELIFDGDSMVVNQKGQVVQRLAKFKEDFKVFDSNMLSISQGKEPKEDYISDIHDALVLGIKDYFDKMGFTKATLGLSGGIDSAVTVVLAARALGPENIKVLLMPSKYSSDHSVNDAEQLAKNLGIEYHTVPIQEMVNEYDKGLASIFEGRDADVTEENIQARVRGTLVMAISNKFGHILLNTSNKSEAAVGYGTLYGDMNGGLAVLGDVYKTDVFKLAWFMNKDGEVIPENSITKPPSAELRPDQKDSDSLPDYDLLDNILYHYIEQKLSASEIIKKGFDAPTVKRVLSLVNRNEYKRFQTAPILRVSSKAFGFGRRMPLVAIY